MENVDFKLEGCASRLHKVYNGEYVTMYEINIDGSERKIFRDCVDELRIEVKPDKLKKVGHSTVYRTYESEEEEESLGGGECLRVEVKRSV